MVRGTRPWTTPLAVLAMGALLAAAPAAAGEAAGPAVAGPDHARLLAEKSPALVTVRFVLQVKMAGMGMDDGQETESEITGVMIDPTGLVLCSNTQLQGMVNVMDRFMGGGAGFDVTATPTELEVLVGDETEGLAASLVARDSDLDLAWIRIDDPRERAFVALDFGAGADLAVGDTFVTLRRLDRYFGRQPVFTEGQVGGVVSRPRKLYVPSTPLAVGYGLPVFDAAGRVAGITVLELPAVEEGATNPLAMMSSLADFQELFGSLVLPASEVARATALAREVSAADAETHAGEEQEQP